MSYTDLDAYMAGAVYGPQQQFCPAPNNIYPGPAEYWPSGYDSPPSFFPHGEYDRWMQPPRVLNFSPSPPYVPMPSALDHYIPSPPGWMNAALAEELAQEAVVDGYVRSRNLLDSSSSTYGRIPICLDGLFPHTEPEHWSVEPSAEFLMAFQLGLNCGFSLANMQMLEEPCHSLLLDEDVDEVIPQLSSSSVPVPDLEVSETTASPAGSSPEPDVTQELGSKLFGDKTPVVSEELQAPNPERTLPKIISDDAFMKDEVHLQKAANAWRPSVKARTRDDSSNIEDRQTQKVLRKMRSILNKLTPEKFASLLRQTTELAIDSEERLKGVVKLIFEKAVNESRFSQLYAKLCSSLAAIDVPKADKPEVLINFRLFLLSLCKSEFAKLKNTDDKLLREEEQQPLTEELELARAVSRKRAVNAVAFIGELYKLNLLKEEIVHRCIRQMLSSGDELNLECACKLLTTAGQRLELRESEPFMKTYMYTMAGVVREKRASSRITFLVQDVIELWQNDWVPRQRDQGLKTLDQVHKQAQMEEEEQMRKARQKLQEEEKQRPDLFLPKEPTVKRERAKIAFSG